MNEDYFITRIHKQGSGLHIYFPSTLIKQSNFPFKSGEAIIVSMGRTKLTIKKVDLRRLMK